MDAAHNAAQLSALGALAVALVDVRCRGEYLSANPSVSTLLAAASTLPGYDDDFQSERRIVAAKTIASAVQRDAFVRECLVKEVHRPPFRPIALSAIFGGR
jgi:hypothetical protein